MFQSGVLRAAAPSIWHATVTQAVIIDHSFSSISLCALLISFQVDNNMAEEHKPKRMLFYLKFWVSCMLILPPS